MFRHLRPIAVLILVSSVALLPAPSATAQSILFVDDDGPPDGNGQSWDRALRNLQVALAIARNAGGAVTEIHVAEGTYRPAPPGGDRTATFQLITGVALRGGYAGLAEPGDPDQRDFDLYETTLSGDLAGDDAPVACDVGSPDCSLFGGLCSNGTCITPQNNSENSYHVVTGSGTDATAVLDGFTIFAGNADGFDLDLRGGGLFNNEGSPTVRRCTFRQNTAWLGGALNNESSSPTVTGCVFEGNSAGFSGGAIRGWDSSPIVTNSLFVANKAESGGAMWYGASTPVLENCTFFANSADEGSALALGSCCPEQPSTLHASNCIFWDGGNEIANTDESTIIILYSDVQGGFVGTGNIDTDPLFVEPGHWNDNATPGDTSDDFWVDGDYRLTSDSPCINTGSPFFIPAPGETDLDGFPRVLCERVDMGAYEFGIGDFDCDRQINLTDFAAFQNCMTGAMGGPYEEGCEALDFDGDGLITTDDFVEFQSVLSRP